MEAIYARHKDINRKKWDACISSSHNRLIYAETVFLDHMSPSWDAIILGDYLAVMPLTWKRKMGVPYLCQPAFSQQGGIFSGERLKPEWIRMFLEVAIKKIRFAEITLNYANTDLPAIKGVSTIKRNNFVLPLNKSYELIFRSFHPDVKQSVRKTSGILQYKNSWDYTTSINLYKHLYNNRLGFKTKPWSDLSNLCGELQKQERLIVREVYHKESNDLLSSCLLLRDNNRLYNIISNTTATGKRELSNYFLYNELVREFAGNELILDFEGSDLKGIAFFYQKFTRENQPYPFVRYNFLPEPLRMIKETF